MQLAEAALHVWRAELTAAADRLGALLSADEHARAQRFVSARDRERWVRAHGILRALLGRYLDCDASALRFSAGAHGKPILEQEGRERDRLCFNLSHSGDLALYAFARAPVGVDVELARPRADVVALAERVFGQGEAERLRELPGPEREREFLRAWVRHEASLKCRGSGLGSSIGERGLWLVELDVGAGAAAAVALDGTPRQLYLWEWTGSEDGSPAGTG